MVNIYLPVKGQQILALSIPCSDIERLSVRLVKWLRFVTFAICGVRGHLSATPNGPPVDYDSISLHHIAEAYYYTPEGDYHMIDHNGLNDRNSSELISRPSNFRSNIMARDGRVCVFTGEDEIVCDAAHLIAKSKGHEYIGLVLQDRRNLYDALEPDGLGINSTENGIFLSKGLHALFAHGHCAFIKTPNFALDTTDIPRVETDPMSPNRITLHHLKPPIARNPIQQHDACMAGTGIPPLSTVVLDYVYGVAAYQCWGSGQHIKGAMEDYFSEHYKVIPPMPNASGDGDDDDGNDDDKYKPRRGRNHIHMSDEMLDAMDDILALSMLLKGTTPKLMAAERQRQEEAEELHAKEASRVKVEQWMQSSEFLDYTFWSNAGWPTSANREELHTEEASQVKIQSCMQTQSSESLDSDLQSNAAYVTSISGE